VRDRRLEEGQRGGGQSRPFPLADYEDALLVAGLAVSTASRPVKLGALAKLLLTTPQELNFYIKHVRPFLGLRAKHLGLGLFKHCDDDLRYHASLGDADCKQYVALHPVDPGIPDAFLTLARNFSLLGHVEREPGSNDRADGDQAEDEADE
jgi:hypothetical protein